MTVSCCTVKTVLLFSGSIYIYIFFPLTCNVVCLFNAALVFDTFMVGLVLFITLSVIITLGSSKNPLDQEYVKMCYFTVNTAIIAVMLQLEIPDKPTYYQAAQSHQSKSSIKNEPQI